MKQPKLLNLATLIILVLSTFLFNGCQTDDSYSNDNQSTLTLENVSVKDILRKGKHEKIRESFMGFKEKFYSMNKNENLQGRFIYNEEFGFFIDEENGKYLEKEGYHSYTFRIIRPETGDKVENIVFSSKSTGEYDIFLTRYDVTDEELRAIDLEQIPNIEKQYYRWNYDGLVFLCIDFTTYLSVYNDQCTKTHENGYTCHPEGVATTVSFCSWSGGGSGSSGGDSGPGSSGGNNTGGSGGNNNNNGNSPLITIIVGAPKQEPNEIEKCQTLNALTQTDPLSANIKPIVDELRTKTGIDKEWYCEFKRSIAYSGEDYKIYPAPEGIQESPTIDESHLTLHPAYIGQIHTHPEGQVAMFSWLDLKALRDTYTETREIHQPYVFIMIVCHNGKVYSLKVDDFIKLNQKVSNVWASAVGSNDREKRNFIERDFTEEYNRKRNNLELAFLKLFKDYGVTLYKASDTNLTNWAKQEIEPEHPNQVKQTPCN